LGGRGRVEENVSENGGKKKRNVWKNRCERGKICAQNKVRCKEK
jgi:hypothetical protein